MRTALITWLEVLKSSRPPPSETRPINRCA